MEIDLSNLGTVNTMFAALFRYIFLKFEVHWSAMSPSLISKFVC